MSTLHAAFAAALLCLSMHARAQPAPELTLDDAIARVADTHPDLRLIDSRAKVLDAERELASLRPALVAGVSIENALGSGDVRGFDDAELTLSLASVLERGGKLDVRRVFAQTRIDALAIERETRRLDLLAEVARRYLAVIGAQGHVQIAQGDIDQRQRTVAAARQRLKAGASPESVVLTAEAALARAELDHARGTQQERAARQHLAALWGERNPDFTVAFADPTVLADIESAAALADLLEQTPELTQFSGEQRIREARLQLARSNASADLSWQLGVRRLQATDDVGLVASLSMPLGARHRARPEIDAAETELSLLGIEREAKDMALYSTLIEAHGRYRISQLEVNRLRDEILPKLGQAERAAERAYRAGAISYLEWAQLQSESSSTRRQQLEVALDAQRALIEIQRLTGQAFIAAPTASAQQGIAQ